ncbi:MAG: hypothetical protein KGJ31_01100 [Patescibacteria group bacterium]|nr:hypothetical protein [Patescibacteria group bacterium]
MSKHTIVLAALLVSTASLGAFAGVAFAQAANGQSCFASTDCASGYCQGDAGNTGGGTCQPNPSQVQTSVTNTGGSGPSISLINPLSGVDCSSGNGNCLVAFLNNILDFVIRIGSIAVILMLVYVGFLFVTARGEPGKISTARQALLWTVVGALILLGAKAISLGIQATVQALSAGS